MNMQQATIGSLLTTIIGNPVTAYDVERILAENTEIPTHERLMMIRGVGPSTANKILALCELSARYMVGTKAYKVSFPADAARRLAYLKFAVKEVFCVMTLDSSNHVINVHEITVGILNNTQCHPREAFKVAILDNAASIILAHNHPSGTNEPSSEDYAITRVLCAAGKVMKIPVIDHIIVSKTGFTSMCRETPELFESLIEK